MGSLGAKGPVGVVTRFVMKRRADCLEDTRKAVRGREDAKRYPEGYDIRAIETHNQEMVVVRGKEGCWLAGGCTGTKRLESL